MASTSELPEGPVVHPIAAKLRSQNKFILGAGAGSGISAKFIEQGGGDLIVIYNSGRFRMAGRGSLAGLMPYGDANAIVLEMAREVLPVVKHTPVLAGVCATDPWRDIPKFLKELKDLGFAGIQNFPTVGLIDGNFRQNLEETGMSYAMEVSMIQEAKKLGLLTTPYCFNDEEARMMAEAGADIIVAHMGLTTKGSIGASTAQTLSTCAQKCQSIANTAHSVNLNILVLVHGGPIAEPEDVKHIIDNTEPGAIAGFFGASSIERLPVEKAIRGVVEEFKDLKRS